MPELGSIEISRGDGGISAFVSYSVLTDGGAVHHGGSIEVPIGGTALQELRTWLNDRVIPDINAQEGMS